VQAKDTAEEFHAADFSAFVASQHAEFRSRIGDGKKVNWTTGKGADGNGDVADLIGATPGRSATSS
jgi:ABC-type phosphate transport system substrate-binding protein